MHRLLTAALLITATAPAFAADEASAARASAAETEKVREIVRGYYLKSNIGSTVYLLTYGGGLLSGVMTVNLAVGSDFIDNEKSSLSWEVIFGQNLQNGAKWDVQTQVLPPNQLIQGDLHLFTAAAVVEASTYPTRRFGVGVRAGGGVSIAPLLMDVNEYNTTVVPAWGGVVSPIMSSPLPVIIVGPTIEYYTKLSHFSLGLDVDAQYVIGLNDLGISPTGYMKYTF